MAIAETNIRDDYPFVTLEDILELAERAQQELQNTRAQMLAPGSRKQPPIISLKRLMHLCGIEHRNEFERRSDKNDLPQGIKTRGRINFPLEAAQAWIKDYQPVENRRPEGLPGFVLTTANFKGGVTKTTTSVSLAQGLSQRGQRVLFLDLDPQGSATTMFGFLPDIDIGLEDTLAPLFLSDESAIDETTGRPSVEYAIKKTYWPGIDLIPASSSLFNAEFALPAFQLKNLQFKFWSVLLDALEKVRYSYDVIVIDTPPALSYITINALWAADGILMPLPPEQMAFASSAQFWSLISEVFATLTRNKADQGKKYAFIDILLAKYEMNPASDYVITSLKRTYLDKLLQLQLPPTPANDSKKKTAKNKSQLAADVSFIPDTIAAKNQSLSFSTIYDTNTLYRESDETFLRARNAFDALSLKINQDISRYWQYCWRQNNV